MKRFYVCSFALALLTLNFVILKLNGSIQWSWLWIFSPIWIVLLVAGLVTVSLIFGLKDEDRLLKNKKERVPKGGLMERLEQLQEAQERLHNEKKQQR